MHDIIHRLQLRLTAAKPEPDMGGRARVSVDRDVLAEAIAVIKAIEDDAAAAVAPYLAARATERENALREAAGIARDTAMDAWSRYSDRGGKEHDSDKQYWRAKAGYAISSEIRDQMTTEAQSRDQQIADAILNLDLLCGLLLEATKDEPIAWMHCCDDEKRSPTEIRQAAGRAYEMVGGRNKAIEDANDSE